MLNTLIMRRLVLSPSTRCQIAGAVRSCDVRRVMFRGFERVVRREVVVDRILFV